MNMRDFAIGNHINVINRTGPVHLPGSEIFTLYEIGIFSSKILPKGTHPASSEFIEIKNSDISPISITENLLETLGAKTTYNNRRRLYFEADTLFYLEISWWSPYKYGLCMDDDVGSEIRQIEFFHELQNVYYWITGEEIC